MVAGRGAIIKPWLPTEIKDERHWDISASERFDMYKRFVWYGLEHWGSDQQGVNTTRRFLLEWLSFTHRYVPVGLIDTARLPQRISQKPPSYVRLVMLSDACYDAYSWRIRDITTYFIVFSMEEEIWRPFSAAPIPRTGLRLAKSSSAHCRM